MIEVTSDRSYRQTIPTIKPKIDVLFLAYNRLEFTKIAISALGRACGLGTLGHLHIYDDGSTDGTAEWLAAWINQIKHQGMVTLHHTSFRHPVAAMNHFATKVCTTPYFAKVDNDAVLPRFSLTTAARVIEHHPELDNLGIEAIAHTVRTIEPRESAVLDIATRTYQKADWISGLGLYRTSQWRDSQPKAFDRWFGLENWMHERNSVCGWIDPAFPVFLLDRLPLPRFQALTAEYAAQGWQRVWPPYQAEQSALWDWCDEVKS